MVAVAAVTLSRAAAAHPIGLSRGDYQVTPQGLDVELTLGRAEALVLVPSLDPNNDDAVDDDELLRARDDLRVHIVEAIRVADRTASCTGTMLGASLTASNALVIRARYRCEDPPAASVTLDLLSDLSRGHRHAVHAVAGPSSKDELCFVDHPAFLLPAGVPADGAAARGRESSVVASALRFTRMGFEHVLRGYDHLVFLFALLLIGGRPRSLLWTATAFTLGHSVTLALATLGVLSLPGRLVECAIALSVAYVGVENVLSPRNDRRWRLTLVFGMVHGFGFAGALAELGLSRAEIAPALVTFNVGVELAQLAAMAVFLPLVWCLRAFDQPRRRLVPAVSLMITICGLVWFVDRLEPARPAETTSAAVQLSCRASPHRRVRSPDRSRATDPKCGLVRMSENGARCIC